MPHLAAKDVVQIICPDGSTGTLLAGVPVVWSPADIGCPLQAAVHGGVP